MEPRSLQYIADACDGELRRAIDAQVSRVVTDSRQAQPGDLFVALKGDRFDAHDFLNEVAGKGVAGIIAEPSKVPGQLSNCSVVAVKNTRRALGQLASRYRADFTLPIIAVGGSNGKTTTKELIASVLKQKLNTLWSEASFNNDIGVPLTLLKLDSNHHAAVLEVGTNHPGELAALLQLIRPRYSVITSIGREHLEFFGDISGVVKEEGALADFLPGSGKLFVNGESEWVKPIVKRSRVPVVKVGQAARLSEVWGKGWPKENVFCARNVRSNEEGSSFSVVAPEEKYSGDYRINLLGRHQVTNALLAISVGAELGLSRAEIQRGLSECKPAKMRMQVSKIGRITLLDDSYNANADSMLAALQTLADFPCYGRRIAVLGDMAELGNLAEQSHEEIGRAAGRLQVDCLFAIGKYAAVTAQSSRNSGVKNVFEIADVENASSEIKKLVQPGDVLLLKASRSSRLERIAEFLKGEREN